MLDKILNQKFYCIDPLNINEKDCRNDFLKSININYFDKKIIKYCAHKIHLHEILRNLQKTLKIKFQNNMQLFLYKYVVDSAKIYNNFKNNVDPDFLDMKNVEYQMEITDNISIDMFDSNNDYFLQLYFEKNFYPQSYFLFLPTLGLRVHDFIAYYENHKNEIIQILDVTIKNYEKAANGPLSVTLSDILYSTFKKLQDPDIFQMCTNRSSKCKAINKTLFVLLLSKSLEHNTYFEIFKTIELKNLRVLLNVFESDVHCLSPENINIYNEFISNDEYKKTFGILERIIKSCCDTFSKNFVKYSVLQKTKYMIIVSIENYLYNNMTEDIANCLQKN
ncbi:hypothetical protein COBT_001892 [Conglomerata obtusa]